MHPKHISSAIGDRHHLAYCDGEVYPLGVIDRKYPNGTAQDGFYVDGVPLVFRAKHFFIMSRQWIDAMFG